MYNIWYICNTYSISIIYVYTLRSRKEHWCLKPKPANMEAPWCCKDNEEAAQAQIPDFFNIKILTNIRLLCLVQQVKHNCNITIKGEDEKCQRPRVNNY